MVIVRQTEIPDLGSSDGPATTGVGVTAMIGMVTGILRRRWKSMLVGLMLSLPIGPSYYFLTPKTYTATATMLMETQRSSLQEALFSGVTLHDASWVDSQLGVLKSQNVAAYVVKQLRLAEDPQFYQSKGPWDRLLSRLGWGAEPETEAERVGAATGAVMSGLDIRRIGGSFMIAINFTSRTSDSAVKVANAIVDGYIFDQLNAKYQANRRAGDWLQERLQALREQTATADRAVIDFKAKNNIVKAGGALMSEKALGDISAASASARARTMDLQTRLERVVAVRQAYQQDQPAAGLDENVTEAMNNAIIARLRGQYLDLMNREADWSVRYGKNHIAVVNLRNQIRDIRKSIRDELGRIEETLKSELQISQSQQDESEKALKGLVSQSNETNQAQVALFSLEATAQSYRKLYDTFLEKQAESVQQQSFPVTDARLMTQAALIKYGPQKLQILMLALLGGGMLGAGVGIARELLDRGFRTRDQIRTLLNAECLALLPVMPTNGYRYRLLRNEGQAGSTARGRQLTRMSGVDEVTAAFRKIEPNTKVWQSIVDAPHSPSAEAIRSVKISLDLQRESAETDVIGLTSSLPGEGKTTVAAAMAASIAQKGLRVLLVDCDLRNPSLTRMLAPEARFGFLEVADGNVALADAVWHDPVTNLEFLPAVTNPMFPPRYDIVASKAAKSFFRTLQIKYDCVIVDLAPLVAGADVQAALRHLDSYVLVVEWGKTKIDEVEYALRQAPGVRENMAGVILNKVDMAAMSLYDRYGAHYYYGRPRH
jgi:succinoglycan biosynthesis transport protein ExoP